MTLGFKSKPLPGGAHAALPPPVSHAYFSHDPAAALHQGLLRHQIEIHNLLSDIEPVTRASASLDTRMTALAGVRDGLYQHLNDAMGFLNYYPSTRAVTAEELGHRQDQLVSRIDSLPHWSVAGPANNVHAEVASLRGQIADFLTSAQRLPAPEALLSDNNSPAQHPYVPHDIESFPWIGG